MHIVCELHKNAGNFISLSRKKIQVNCAGLLFSGTLDYLVKVNDKQCLIEYS